MLYVPRKTFLVTTILVILLSFTKNTEAGFPVLDEAMALWGYIETFRGLSEDPHQEIMDQFKKVSNQLTDIKKQIAGLSDTMESLFKLVQISGDLQSVLNDIYNSMINVDAWYKEVKKYLKDFPGYLKHENESMLVFAKNIALGTNTAKICMEQLSSMIIQPRLNGKNFIQTLNAYNEVGVCVKQITTPQLLYTFYTKILTTQVKAFLTTSFSFMASKLIEKKTHPRDMQHAKMSFIQNINDLTASFKLEIQRANQTIYKCDPKVHVAGETFDRITKLIQGYVSNEYFLSYRKSCKSQCTRFDNTLENVPCHRKTSPEYCRSPCRTGITFDCRDASGARSTIACLVNIFSLETTSNMSYWTISNNTKRFSWVKDNNGEYGKKTDDCNDKIRLDYFNADHVSSSCYPCYCLCDEEGPTSHRSFSLDPVKSDIQVNKVVTGIRLRKDNRVFKFEIQQGKLLPYGKIDTSTLQWLDRRYKPESIFTMRHNRRSISLQEQRSHFSNAILTGVRFMFRESTGILGCDIHVTRFNFSSGKVDALDSWWQSSDRDAMTELVLNEPDEWDLNIKSESTYKPNQYIKFTHTDWKKDFAQTTVPYIDIQSVVQNPPAPLSGFGLHHKGKDGYGGFIAPKLLSLEYDRYMEGI